MKLKSSFLFWLLFSKKTPKFSTFFSNISKRKLIRKDLITTYEEEIQCFFASRLICVHRLKWVRKLNIYIIFLVIFEIGAKNAQNQDFTVYKYCEKTCLHKRFPIIYIPKNLILSIFSRQAKNLMPHFDQTCKAEK